MKYTLAFVLLLAVFATQTQDAESKKLSPFEALNKIGAFLATFPGLGPLVFLPIMPILMPILTTVLVTIWPILLPFLPDANNAGLPGSDILGDIVPDVGLDVVADVGLDAGLDALPGVGDLPGVGGLL